MSQLIPQNQMTETDNLSDVRVRRLQQLEGEITRHIVAAKQAVAVLENSDAAIADLLYSVQQEGLFKVDKYANMTEYARIRWPDLSKVELSHMLTFGRINARVASWNEGQELTNSPNLLTPLQSPGQARAAATIPEEELIPTLILAQKVASGKSPSARVITETYNALSGKDTTDERISRLDTDKTAKQPDMSRPSKTTYGWGEDLAVNSAGLVLTARRPDFKKPDGSFFKTRFPLRLTLHQLALAGFIHENNRDGLCHALAALDKRATEEDADSRAEPPAAESRESKARRGMTPQPAVRPDLFADDSQEEPVIGSFTAGIDFSDIDQLTDGGFQEWAQ